MIDSQNIVAAFEAADPGDLAQGLQWYDDARDTAGELGRGLYSPEQVAGVIAAMSPMMGWAANIDIAARLIARHAEGKRRPSSGYGLKRNVAKAWAILNGEPPLAVLSGAKVRAFFANIMGDPHAVTVDRWAIRIAHADPSHPGTCGAREHREIAAAYRAASATVGVSARELQAATWVHYRRLHGSPHHDYRRVL